MLTDPKTEIIEPNEKPWLWKPGQSGNPQGAEAKLRTRVLHYAKGKSLKAIRYLANVVDNEKVSPAVRVQAALAVLDRAWGKPKQALEIENQGQTLEQLLTAIWDEREKRREQGMLDVTPAQQDTSSP